MKKKMMLVFFVAAAAVSAKVLIVPHQYPTLQKAIHASHCQDTIMFDSVPDNSKIIISNKVLRFVGVPTTVSFPSVYTAMSIKYSRCTFEKINLLGLKGSKLSVGDTTLSIFGSEVGFDSCYFRANMFSSLSKITISNSMHLNEAWCTTVQGLCLSPPSVGYYLGASVKDSSIIAFGAAKTDSLIIDSTSSIATNQLAPDFNCFVYGSDTVPFSFLNTVNLAGARSGTVTCVDYNDDGRMDITVSDADNFGDNWAFVTWGYMFMNNDEWNFYPGPGLRDWAEQTRIYTFFRTLHAEWVDLNNSGNPEYLKGSPVERQFYQSNVPTGLHPFATAGDCDNDGKLEVIELAESSGVAQTHLWKYNPEEKATFSRISHPFPAFYEGSASWGDFDKDGDLDLIIGNQYTMIFRNDNGTFTFTGDTLPSIGRYGACMWVDIDNDGTLEAIINGIVYEHNNGVFAATNLRIHDFSDCDRMTVFGDYDNDGKLDVFTLKGVYHNETDTFMYIGMHPLTFDKYNSDMFCSVACGDFDNDGTLDICQQGNDKTLIHINNCRKKNTSPSVPHSLQTVRSDTAVIFRWDPAIDAETPQAALSYEMRVGTTPGGYDIMSTTANRLTGFRRVPGMGNCGLNSFYIVKGLRQGIYYWTVQAVDNGWKGSRFAEEQSLTIGPVGVIAASDGNHFRIHFQNKKILVSGSETFDKVFFRIFDSAGRLLYGVDKTLSANGVVPLKSDMCPGMYFYAMSVFDKNNVRKMSRFGKLILL